MSEQTHRIHIASDFSKFPAGRFVSDGPYSGESCRRRLLAPALRAGGHIVVELDGTLGYGSSFLEEAFGGLVREEHFTPADLRARLSIESADGSLVDEIWSYIEGDEGLKRCVG